MWYNDPTSLRNFLIALIEAEEITDLEEVVDYCTTPQKYNDAYKQWEENGFSFGDEEAEDDETE